MASNTQAHIEPYWKHLYHTNFRLYKIILLLYNFMLDYIMLINLKICAEDDILKQD